jgi:hypothetical protein
LPDPDGAEMINKIPAMRFKQCNRGPAKHGSRANIPSHPK